MKHLNKRKNDMNMPIGKLTAITDFLPPPNALLPKIQTLKITLKVDEPTVKFFKGEANKSHMKYQRMMREVLNLYARKYSRK